MEAPNKMMDIHITFGKKDNLQDLADITGILTTDTNQAIQQLFQVNQIVQQSKFNQDIGQDSILVFHFYTQQGKQKQAMQYFQDAINQNIQQALKSPLQLLIQNPTSQGKLQIVQGQGCIILKYRFPLQTNPELSQIDPILANYQIPKVNLQLCMKGFLSHNKKNRTNVKVDYADFELSSQVVKPSQLLSFLEQMEVFQSSEISNPLVQLIGKTKLAQIKMKFLSFRSIMSFYSRAAFPQKQKSTKQFNYTNHGIFRKQTTFFAIYNNKIAIKFDGTYNSEDVFIRLVKVYTKFLKNGL